MVLVIAATVAVYGCGGSSNTLPSPSGAGTTSMSTLSSSIPTSTGEVTIGPSIEASPDTPFLKGLADAHHTTNPLAAYGRSIIVATEPFQLGPAENDLPFEYSLWDPASGSVTPAWEGAPGDQDVSMVEDGVWLATVRTGRSLPFPAWEIILRNLTTGEERQIAESDPNVASLSDIRLGITGFAPTLSVWGGKLVWTELTTRETGSPAELLRLYNIDDQSYTTLLTENDASTVLIWSPAVGDNKVAYLRNSEESRPTDIIIYDLETQQRETIVTDDRIYSMDLTKDGRYLVWGNTQAKWSLDLTTGEKVKYADTEGWGTLLSGHYVSWAPGDAYGQPGGLYNLDTHELRLLNKRQDVATNIAQPMGDWFIWQEIPSSNGERQYDQAKWYALKLD